MERNHTQGSFVGNDSNPLFPPTANTARISTKSNSLPTIEEGRGQGIRHLLLKFTQEYDQQHYFQLPPHLSQSIYLYDSTPRPSPRQNCGVVLETLYCKEFYTLYVTRFRIYKIGYPSQDKKSRRGNP